MDEHEFEEFLLNLLATNRKVEEVKSFKEAGVLTNNRGMEVEIDGKKFQVTIVAE